MPDEWNRRIGRADDLAARDPAARPLLRAYRQLLQLQRDAYTTLHDQRDALSGDLVRDLPYLRACAMRMLSSIDTVGPPLVASEAPALLAAGEIAIDDALRRGWDEPDAGFVARLALQPYAECLAHTERRPVARPLQRRGAACPFCGGAPQLSILHGGSSEGGGRSLQCGTCATTWPFRRVLCAQCGSEDERQLGYFQAPAFDHVRIDVCEGCRQYLKTIDLNRLGHAVPLVDEVASGSLDVWAADQGYRKIERNLVGL